MPSSNQDTCPQHITRNSMFSTPLNHDGVCHHTHIPDQGSARTRIGLYRLLQDILLHRFLRDLPRFLAEVHGHGHDIGDIPRPPSFLECHPIVLDEDHDEHLQ